MTATFSVRCDHRGRRRARTRSRFIAEVHAARPTEPLALACPMCGLDVRLAATLADHVFAALAMHPGWPVTEHGLPIVDLSVVEQGSRRVAP